MTTLYYRGRRMLNDGKLGETFVRAENGGPLLFTPKKRLSLIIGKAYEIEETEPGTFVLGSAVPNRDLPQHEQAAEWRADSMAAEGELEAAKAKARIAKAAKETNKDIGDLTLDDLREMFARSLPDQKAALMTVIIRHVRPY